MSKIDDLRGKLAARNGGEQNKDVALRASSAENPLSQEEILKYAKENSEMLFDIEKVGIAVDLTKAIGGEKVQTKTLARDGRVIEETSNVAKEGFAIDSRKCLDGSPDQYAKKPEKAGSNNYMLDDGRTFAEMEPGETAKAHTVGGEQRKAMVAEKDMYLQASWGEVQFVAKGGLVTFMGDEAIGNNNPCDMVITNGERKGNKVLTSSSYEIRRDLESSGVQLSDGAKKFLEVAAEEDRKNPYLPRGNSKDLENM